MHTKNLPRLRKPIKAKVFHYLNWLVPVLSILVALFLGGVLLKSFNVSPIRAYTNMLQAAFLEPYSLSDTTVKATPLILAGLGVALSFRMKQWNIGAEGQLYFGAWAATGVALHWLPRETPAYLMIPSMMVMAILAGAAWAAIPAVLKAYRGVNEIITSLMFNYIGILYASYFVYGPWNERGFGLTPQFPRTAWLPRLADFTSQYPALSGLTAHAGIFFGLIAAVILWFLLRQSQWGYELRVIGDNIKAARYAGMNVEGNILLVMMISGGLAGLAGMAEVSGVVHRLQERFSPGYGYTAIIVALLGRLNPLVIVLVAYLFGGLLVGGDVVQPLGIPLMIQGIVLFCVISGELLLRLFTPVESLPEETLEPEEGST